MTPLFATPSYYCHPLGLWLNAGNCSRDHSGGSRFIKRRGKGLLLRDPRLGWTRIWAMVVVLQTTTCQSMCKLASKSHSFEPWLNPGSQHDRSGSTSILTWREYLRIIVPVSKYHVHVCKTLILLVWLYGNKIFILYSGINFLPPLTCTTNWFSGWL